MAKKVNSSIPLFPNRFDKGLNTDIRDNNLDNVSWTHARNAINNTHIGEPYGIGNEPSNKFCSSAPYDIIGAIHIEEGKWWIFSTNDASGHEIGIFDEKNCSYETIVNAPCLKFSLRSPIYGVSRPTHDCSHRVYWADGINPDRTLDMNAVPWIQDCVDSNGVDPGGCITCSDTTELDCDKIRLEVLMNTPCTKITRGPSGGSILNGSYYIQVAYMVNSQRVTDYFPMSNVLHIFEHDEANASIDIELTGLDEEMFDEYQLVIVQHIAQKTSTRIVGIFSTNQDRVSIDIISPEWETIDSLNDLVVTNPVYDKSEAIFAVDKYMYRVAPTGKFDFNYQPLANQISSKWQVIEYPENYYKNGGTNVGYMRDEVYSFFIRFRYATGDVSNSYHIPGRPAQMYEIPTAPPGPAIQMMEDDDYLVVGPNNLEDIEGLTSKVFEMFNTANGTNVSIPLDDGGLVVAEGQMGYWESDTFYPDNKPQVWNTNDPANPQWDLCGKRIRHHKFPENTLYAGIGSNVITNHYKNNTKTIRIMGVAFDNIQPPVDNNGVLIPNIIGYEILRGSRDGNKTVLYKGLINNMRKYDVPDSVSSQIGLYPNYPFNSLYPDAFHSTQETSYEPLTGNSGTVTNPTQYQNYIPNTLYSKKHFTFHCPDTMFNKPFLGQKELKIYGAAHGRSHGIYIDVDNHPKHVFVTDLTFFVGLVIGVGYAIAKQVGKEDTRYPPASKYEFDILKGGYTGVYTYTQPFSVPGPGPVLSAIDAAVDAAVTSRTQIVNLTDTIAGLQLGEGLFNTAQDGGHDINIVNNTGITTYFPEKTYRGKSSIPPLLRVAQAIPTFVTDVTEGADLTIDIIRKASREKQFAKQYQGYCGYESFASPYLNNRRRIINDAVYLKGNIQNYDTSYRINNVLRANTVALDTTVDVENIIGSITDETMRQILISDLGTVAYKNHFFRTASSHYVAMKSRNRNQYGQLHSIKQLPTTSCVIPIDSTSTGTLFGGDTYIGRYQEKNTMYHFHNWLLGQPDRAEFNYHLYDALQHAAFWADTEPFDVTEFINSIPSSLSSAVSGGSGFTAFFQNLVTPSDKTCLDRLYNNGNVNGGVFTLKNAFFYLFHSSVRDFFVESEINIDMRDWEDDFEKQHYAVLPDLRTLFHSSRIRAGNYYKIDRGLSVAKMPFSKLSWGKLQDREYDPELSETCYTYYPRRIQYSLPQQTMLKRDNWSAFLANNYKDFASKVTAIKSIQNTGIMILFESMGPRIFPGIDELFLQSGTSITVGDGNLFARDAQPITDADKEFEYGSCQNKRVTINTPMGIFYISQNQGKIFQIVGKGIKEIMLGNRYWLNQYLPYQILEDFPEYDMLDNPIAGVACQAIFDNEWGIVYFMKRDFKLRPEWKGRVIYEGLGKFLFDGIYRAYIGDPLYFEDASWTLSYDPKRGSEISWHDWHPNLCLSGKNTFMTIKNDNIWRHNKRCDNYCNFYGIDYPFEIEYQIDGLPAVTTLRSIEYFLQCFIFSENCRDRFHVLDFNFDELVIYNSEQVSGVLRLNLEPKNNIAAIYQYPIVGLNQIDILYSKEEQKYRINQFWDITRDRGEYSPLVAETIWNTYANGYIRILNPNNLNYNKLEWQRKKFRHNQNRLLLKRLISGNKKMILTMVNTKIQNSSR